MQLLTLRRVDVGDATLEVFRGDVGRVVSGASQQALSTQRQHRGDGGREECTQ